MKNIRTASASAIAFVTAGLAASIPLAQAVHLSPDGLGQVLIYPYYTVNADNSTLLSIVNTKSRGKIVKVQILEAYNGQEVLDFNLFLSAYDVWTANLFALTPTGPGNLLTDDESCTIPDIKGNTTPQAGQLPAPDGRSYFAFRTGQLQTDGGPKTADRTREGHVQIIEMATIAAGSVVEDAISHVNGVPPGCASLTTTVQSNLPDLRRLDGGLFGSANIVNPQLGTLIGYNADAIDDFYALDTTLYNGESPRLDDARTTATTAVAHTAVPYSIDGPNVPVSSTYSATNALDAVSAIFTASALVNEYVVESNSASESEWVINFPTKKRYVNIGSVGIPPFIERFAAPGRSCVAVDVSYLDREERLVPNIGGDLDPPLVPSLCYQTQVLTFRRFVDYAANGGVSAVLGSKLTINADPRTDAGFSSGWLRINMNPTGQNSSFREPHALRPSTDLDVYNGLPVTGFLATNYLNRNNGGPNVLSTYSTGARHRIQRDCANTTHGGDGYCH